MLWCVLKVSELQLPAGNSLPRVLLGVVLAFHCRPDAAAWLHLSVFVSVSLSLGKDPGSNGRRACLECTTVSHSVAGGAAPSAGHRPVIRWLHDLAVLVPSAHE